MEEARHNPGFLLILSSCAHCAQQLYDIASAHADAEYGIDVLILCLV